MMSPYFPFGRTDLCEDSPVFNSLIYHPLHLCVHHRGVLLQQSFEFYEQRVKGFRLCEQY